MIQIRGKHTARYRVSRSPYTGKNNIPIKINYIDGQPVGSLQLSTDVKHEMGRSRVIGDPVQRRAGRNLAIFLAMILVFTFISRGTAAAALAKVTTVSPVANEVVSSIKSSGVIRAGDSIELLPPEALKVRKVLVSPGEEINEGESILAFDQAEVEEELARAEIKLKEDNIKLEKLMQNLQDTDSTLPDAEKKYSWAQEDLADARNKTGNSISQAQKSLDDANKELQTAIKLKDDLEKEVQKLESTASQTVSGEAQEYKAQDSVPEISGENSLDENNTAENDVYERLAQARENVSAAQTQAESAKSALDAAIMESETTLKQSRREAESAKDSLNNAEKTRSNSVIERENQRKEKDVEAETLKLDIQIQEKKVENLRILKQNEGIFKAAKAGSVQKLPDTGAGEGVSVILADTSGGYVVELSIGKEDADSLVVGMEAELIDTSGSIYNKESHRGLIKEIGEPDADKLVQVTIALPEGSWEQGKTLEIRIVKERMKHSSCVPLSAVRSNSTGKYILMIEQRTTVLGTENVLIEVAVEVLMTGDDSAAIEGMFSGNEKIVKDSTKPVAAGDRVRVNIS